VDQYERSHFAISFIAAYLSSRVCVLLVLTRLRHHAPVICDVPLDSLLLGYPTRREFVWRR
jgi:hypothetical protein